MLNEFIIQENNKFIHIYCILARPNKKCVNKFEIVKRKKENFE